MKIGVILVLSFFVLAAIVFVAGAADTTIKGTTTDSTVCLDVTDSEDTSRLYVTNDGSVVIPGVLTAQNTGNAVYAVYAP